MWFCFKDGFVSAVTHLKDPSLLVIRARRRKDLESVLPGHEVHEHLDRDYRYRAFVRREEFAALVSGRILDMTATNFKDSVYDDDLHDLYLEFWRLHAGYQRSEGKPRPTQKLGNFESFLARRETKPRAPRKRKSRTRLKKTGA